MNIKKFLKSALDFVKYNPQYDQCLLIHFDSENKSTYMSQSSKIDDYELSNLIFKMWLDIQKEIRDKAA